MRNLSRVTLTLAVAFSSAAFALFSGCGGDDTNGAGSGDSGASSDGTTGNDGSLSRDGATNDSGAIDSGRDSGDAALPPPHVAFITSVGFTGDLIGEALAIESDAGLDAGDLADAGDGGTAYLAASDILCTHVAHAAGLTGSYAAILSAGADDPLDRFTDADGPWALVNGTPIADTVADLRTGKWRNSIDVTESGVSLPHADLFVWARGSTGADCSSWSSTSGFGGAGSYTNTSGYGIEDGAPACTSSLSLYCAQVGSGAGPNRYPAIPAGGKLAFVVDESLPGNFALSDAGVLDASAPDAGDDVHSVADAICTEFARGEGKTGNYHAWVSSTTTDAKTFFTNHAMNGPWFRADGMEIAATLDELTTTGARTQLETRPDGTIAANLGDVVRSGTDLAGTTSTFNCVDFTSIASSDHAQNGRTSYKSTDWANRNAFPCNNTGGIYCFEE